MADMAGATLEAVDLIGLMKILPHRYPFLMVDKITTVRRSNARTVLGRLEATTLVEFERRLLVFLGFGA